MADDKTKRGRAADRIRINMQEPYEVVYWSKRLECSQEELEEAVQTVGVNAEDVQTFIAARKVAGGQFALLK